MAGPRIVKAKDAATQGFLKLALYGKAGSGKTLTSLLIAEGLGGPVLYVDTEDGTTFYRRSVAERSVHPEAFEFDLLLTKSFSEVIEALETVGKNYRVVVIDSVTHLWEAAQNAYQGPRTSKGSIPIQAWSTIKKPWKRMVNLGMDGDFHFILCGREGVLMEENDQGELAVVGAKMKAEGETPYEPHVLGRMVPERLKDGSQEIRVFFEKDRSGVLAGKTFANPSYGTVEPLVRYLSGDAQPKVGSAEDAADRDAEAFARAEEKADAERRALYQQIETAILAATTLDQLKAAWSLTGGKKTKLGDLFEQLEAAKDARKRSLVEAA